MAHGIDESIAQVVVISILANEIPRVSLDFSAQPAVKTARESFDEARAEAGVTEDQAALV